MNEPALLLDCMPQILCLAFGMFALGMVIGFVSGFWRGRVRTSGDILPFQDLTNRYDKLCGNHNVLQAEIERLREELKHGLSID